MFEKLFGRNKNNTDSLNSAQLAKRRLTIAIMTDRKDSEEYPFMEEMKAEIMEVIKKYIGVKKVEVTKETEDGIDALAIEVLLAK